ncbi:MAG: riboflavin biosynthesis protein RibD, partial [Rhodococcus sp. (in: high G+C Gram-positive bacteria)]
MRAEAEETHRSFLHFARTGKPFVVVKAATTLDGRIALPNGESQWITGPAARTEGYRLRAELGAVLVGRGTVEADDPHLTARIPGVTDPPVRIVLDPARRLSSSYRVFDSAAPTWRVGMGGEIDPPRLADEGLDLVALLAELGARGLTGLLIEGGGRTIGG